MGWLISRLIEWATQSVLAKTSGVITLGIVVGVMSSYATTEVRIDGVALASKALIEEKDKEMKAYLAGRREVRDEQFKNIDTRLGNLEETGKYLRGAIDETNRNVLLIVKDRKK